MGKLDGKVAFITGAARGQGRSHAIRLAQEGADIIAVDICKGFSTVPYTPATPADLQQTVKEVEALDRRIVARQADVRDFEALQAAFDEGVAELGACTIVVANAGIGPGGEASDEEQWADVVAVNLTGVWNTCRVAIPQMMEADQGGSIVLTSSTGGLIGAAIPTGGFLGYTASKHGVIGLMRSFSNVCAPYSIRVNSVAPTTVDTPMTDNPELPAYMEAVPELGRALRNAMPVFKIDPIDVSHCIAWLVSDEARYVTGSVIPVDAGNVNYR
jgi:SDR family mycofactocin-dependent oxidoreductase